MAEIAYGCLGALLFSLVRNMKGDVYCKSLADSQWDWTCSLATVVTVALLKQLLFLCHQSFMSSSVMFVLL